jgi:hypothetical protein
MDSNHGYTPHIQNALVWPKMKGGNDKKCWIRTTDLSHGRPLRPQSRYCDFSYCYVCTVTWSWLKTMGEYFRLHTCITFSGKNTGTSWTPSALQNDWRELDRTKSSRFATAASTWEWGSPVSADIYNIFLSSTASNKLLYMEPTFITKESRILNATYHTLSPITGRKLNLNCQRSYTASPYWLLDWC